MSFLGTVAGGLLKTVAPTIATAMGGPLAGMAVGWVAKKVLGQEDATLDDISKFLTTANDPQALQKMKDAERDFAAHMKELDIDVFKLEVQDRASARDFGVKTKIGAWMQLGIGVFVVIGFFMTVAMVLSGSLNIEEANKAVLVGTVIGYVSAKADQVIAFLFGTTHGSSEKSEQLTKVLQASATNGK